MKSLQEFINTIYYRYDCHSHFFDHDSQITDIYSYPTRYNKVVGFADVVFDTLSKYNKHQIIDYYNEFIKSHYNSNKHILLSTGANSYDVLKIQQDHNDIIKGFGEFKCYKIYRGKDIQFGNLNWIRPVCEKNVNNLPVYIHWVLKDLADYDELVSLIVDYPNTPFVLCHFGMGHDKTVEISYSFAFKCCQQLLHNFDNIYFDLSYKALEYFINVPYLLNEFKDRTVIGSDLNPQVKRVMSKNEIGEKITDTYKAMDALYVNEYTDTARKLFSNINVTKSIELTNYDLVVSNYLYYLRTLPLDKQQHFVTRMNLIQPMYIKSYMINVANDANEISQLITDKKYDDIIKHYVLNPYITTNDPEHKKVADWIKSIKNESTKYLLSVGILCDKLSIVTRNGFDNLVNKPDLDVDNIYDLLLKDNDLFKNETTLWINCAGYIYNVYNVDFDKWRKLYRKVLSGDRDLRNIYGLTHVLLQASNFYTKKIDCRYTNEINEVINILEQERSNNYSNYELDLLFELALCLKYSYEDTNSEISDVLAYAETKFNTGKELFITSKETNNIEDDIVNNEHTNALYILLKEKNRFLK